MTTKSPIHIPDYKALMRYARMLRFGEIHTRIDRKTGLHAIIAIHNTKLGPAIGGCRCYHYAVPELALKDVLRLAYAMTLKAAAAGLPHGGAKSVILKPKTMTNRKDIFRAFGDFVHDLNGKYIAAVDVGSTIEDMTTMAERTPYAIGAALPGRVDIDPSPSTALGVFRCIQAAIQFKWGRDDCKGLRVAVQGVGRVGYHLAKHLVEAGAKVTVADVSEDNIAHAMKTLDVTVVSPDAIDSIDCDIFSPCAMGGTINLPMIQHNKAKIIAGAANNQLAHHTYARTLKEAGVLCLPDFFINAGGLINAATVYTYQNLQMAEDKVNELYDKTLALLKRATNSDKTITEAAEEMAIERLEA